ncbi:hypothetical protein OUZ56_011755 [Daphnia magna]|uniref:Uncharacterized protein n=1 Tax=Daphnia magna TaxID=35525 RepID=A0ABQ9Z131_9CRUS|nr:hypothetical protein OUZ56_011755 [Daphnia magna]
MDIKPSEIYYYYPTPYTPHPKIVIVLRGMEDDLPYGRQMRVYHKDFIINKYSNVLNENIL